MTIEPPVCGDEAMWTTWMAAFHAPTLAVADELGLFPALRDAPLTTSELAAHLAIELRATESIAGLMAALGFLMVADGRYHLTETARTYLLPTSRYYWGGMLRRIRDNPLDCRKLIASLRAGKAKADAPLTDMWRAPMPPPEALVAFTHAMHAHSFAIAMRAVPMFGLPASTRLLDVGGGSGSYSIAASVSDPSIHCTVLDLAAVCGVTTDYARQCGVSERVGTVAANMFEDAWPRGHDHVLMADIFHDWSDERCQLLAARAYESLPRGGRVLLHEMLLSDAKDGPLGAIAYSMIMVFVTEGRQRSASELRQLLTAAGFSDIRIKASVNGYALVEGTRS